MLSISLRGIFAAVIGLMLMATGQSSGATPDEQGEYPMATTGPKFYVATGGNDAWSGTRPDPNAKKTDGPLATPARARDAVRALKAAGQLVRPVTVYLRGGTYFLTEPLALTPEDSGAEAAPITWKAYRNEKPVLSGGVRVTGFKKGEGGRWTAPAPAGIVEGRWKFRQLFVNGRRANRTRLPKNGYYRVMSTPGMPKEQPSWNYPSDKFEFSPGEIRADWTNLGDVEIRVLHFWIDTHLLIKEVDEAARIVTFDRTSRARFVDDFSPQGARYFAENVREALEDPGQWYLDRQAGVVHYLPIPGEDMRKADVIAPRLPAILRLEGRPEEGKWVEHVAFEGLVFRYAEYDLPPDDSGSGQAADGVPGAVWARGARHVRIEGCEVSQCGTYGIQLADGCRRVAIVGNELADLGAGGVRLSGSTADGPESLRTGEAAISDNHIHDCGQIWLSAVGILLQHADRNLIAHNHVHNINYSGISVGWVWGYTPSVSRDNIIEFNHVHDIGKGLLSDMGGIYTLGVSPGTVIRNNVFHDIRSHGYGGWGIYTDEGSTDILIENNVVYRTKTGGFHQHYGKENIIRNNIFAFAGEGQLQRSRDNEDHLSFTFERNIVYWAEGPLLHSNWTNRRYRLDRNLYFNVAGRPINCAGRSFQAWQAEGQDRHSRVADPMFVSPPEGDYRLKKGSPALKLGFKTIDTSGVGIRPKNER